MTPIHHLTLFQVFNQAIYSGARFLVAVYAVSLGASAFTVGLLTGLFSIAPAVLAVPTGKLIDRIGTKQPLNIAQAVMCVLTLLICVWPTLPLLHLFAALLGSAFFVVFVGLNALINHHSDADSRAGNFSLMTAGISISQGAAPLLLGFCADHFGYVTAFAVTAVFPLLSWAVFTLSGVSHIRERKPQAKPARQGSTLGLLRDPKLRAVVAIGMMFTTSWGIFLALMPIHGTEIGLSASQMGMVMMAYSVAAFLVRAFAGKLTRRHTPWQMMLGSLVVAALGTIGFGLSAALPLLLVFACIQGLGQGLGTPMSTTAVYETAPKGRSNEAMGLRLSISTGAMAAIPLLVGSLSAIISVAPVFVASGVMLLAGAYAQRRQWNAVRPRVE